MSRLSEGIDLYDEEDALTIGDVARQRAPLPHEIAVTETEPAEASPLAVSIGPDRSWTDRAACEGLDSDLFFPERGASVTEAKAVCAGCPVREQCLEYALDTGEKYGIWGGLSERERRRIRRTRNAARSNAAQCGTRSKYSAGCRCVPCRQANADYLRQHRMESVG